jgi:hypothetical protein
MKDDRTNQDAQKQTQESKSNNNSTGQTGSDMKPQDRLNDGTNDFQNGDQEPTSERSSKEGE